MPGRCFQGGDDLGVGHPRVATPCPNLCGHPYSLQIRSHVLEVGKRTPASSPRYSWTVAPTSQAARQTRSPFALPIALHHRRE